MFEHFVIYDLETGSELWRGSGPAGAGAAQTLPEGTGIIFVPREVVAQVKIDLTVLREALCVGVDNAAEQARARFVTALPAQIGTYVLKEAAARAWLADNDASVVMLAPEATARGMTVEALANEVIANAEAWARLSGAIEGVRFAAKARIAAATTIGTIAAAALVDWSALDAPA